MVIYHGSKMIVRSPEIWIQKYNKDWYYQSREYISECYREGKICA